MTNLGKILAAAALSGALATGAAQAGQVALAPSNVIGSSGYYTACCSFQPGYILDQQTGPIIEGFGSGYWLNPDNGPANAFITVDLGQVTNLSSVVLFNVHNGDYNDRGTGNFTIKASNAVTDLGGGNFGLVGGATIVTGTLAPESSASASLTPQSFAALGAYRYLSFNPTSVSVSGSPCCGANVYGLDELRVFSSPTPEPAAWALMLLGFGGLGASLRARRQAAVAPI